MRHAFAIGRHQRRVPIISLIFKSQASPIGTLLSDVKTSTLISMSWTFTILQSVITMRRELTSSLKHLTLIIKTSSAQLAIYIAAFNKPLYTTQKRNSFVNARIHYSQSLTEIFIFERCLSPSRGGYGTVTV